MDYHDTNIQICTFGFFEQAIAERQTDLQTERNFFLYIDKQIKTFGDAKLKTIELMHTLFSISFVINLFIFTVYCLE